MRRLRVRFARTPGVRWLPLFASGLLALGVGTASAGEIYRWTDDQGRLHFSQDIRKVPPDKRVEAKRQAKQRPKHDPLQFYGTPSSGGSGGGRDAGPAAFTRQTLGSGRGTMRIPFERHGTLMRVEVLLNGRVRAPFFIDTGASGVSIPWSVAQRLGIQITHDTPRIQVRTANGVVAEPLVQLSSVQLGPARVENLEAAVSGSMEIGLLGGAFFNNYVYQVDAAAGVITLKPNAHVRGGMNPTQWRERFDKIREPLQRLEAYLEEGGFTDEGRVRELEQHREQLRAALDELEREANKAGVPRGWRQ
jgi:clan AA aspartic protease (TIGR02281 family)